MNWKGFGRSGLGLILRYYPGICLERLKKTTKKLSQDSRHWSWDFNVGPNAYRLTVPCWLLDVLRPSHKFEHLPFGMVEGRGLKVCHHGYLQRMTAPLLNFIKNYWLVLDLLGETYRQTVWRSHKLLFFLRNVFLTVINYGRYSHWNDFHNISQEQSRVFMLKPILRMINNGIRRSQITIVTNAINLYLDHVLIGWQGIL
jgi:hypothetical protein